MQRADKPELRRKLLDARAARSEDELESARAAIRAHALDRCATQRWRTVAAYEPLRTEPGSIELLAQLAHAGVRVLVPVLLDDRDLDWAEWGTDVPLGVDAIAAVDAVLAPALAVSLTGVRLGRGGGSYDRALARVPAEVATAALVFDDEVLDELPTDPWDVRVGWALTPSGWTGMSA